MNGLASTPLRLMGVIGKLRGQSLSLLIECDDNRTYVAKLHPNRSGVNALRNEAIGAHLLRGLGICSPESRCLLLTPDDVEWILKLQLPEMSKYPPEQGLHFVSHYPVDPSYHMWDRPEPSLNEVVTNSTDFIRMYVFDLWARHVDARQYLYRRNLMTGKVHAMFIDNGHLFGGAGTEAENDRFPVLYSGVERPRTDEPEVYWSIADFQRKIPQCLSVVLPLISTKWYHGSLAELEEWLLWRLKILDDLVARDLRAFWKIIEPH